MPLLPNKLYQGDCIEKLADVEPASVDLVFADPPFNIGYEYDVYDDRRSRDEFVEFSRKWMTAVDRVLKPTGTFWLAIGDEYAAELKLVAQDDIGLTCRSWVIWYYTFGVNCVRGFSRSHTHLFHFVKDADHFTFNGDNPAVRVASARQLVYADARANSRGRLPDNTWILRPQDAPENSFTPMHDTWYFSRVAGTFKEREGFHGCQMPEQLLGRIIRASSNPGELVLDPFAGSGTTLATAKKLGRQWMGFELSPEYVKRVEQRLAGCRVGDPLDGAADPLRSAPTTAKGKKRGRFRNGRPVVALDKETERGIIAAFEKSCAGCSADFVLCDPELNRGFVDACKKRSVPGDARIWNQLLLRIRKAGKLPKSSAKRKRLKSADMDSFHAATEAAMQLLCLDYALTLDEVLCSPAAAAEFDRLAGQFAGVAKVSAFEFRWAALAIRKRAKKSRKRAIELSDQWDATKLDEPLPLEKCASDKFELPGVYVIADHSGTLYIGETRDVRARVEQILSNELWMNFRPRSAQIVEIAEQKSRYAVQSILIGQLNPFLNSTLLRPDRSTPQADALLQTTP